MAKKKAAKRGPIKAIKKLPNGCYVVTYKTGPAKFVSAAAGKALKARRSKAKPKKAAAKRKPAKKKTKKKAAKRKPAKKKTKKKAAKRRSSPPNMFAGLSFGGGF